MQPTGLTKLSGEMLSFAIAFSYHLGGEQYDFNWMHPHLRYTTEQQQIAGAYYNSEYNTSLYVGQKFVEGHLELGLVSGYNSTIYPYLRVVKDGFYVTPAIYGGSRKIGLVVGYEIGF